MYPSIHSFLAGLIPDFEAIPAERKALLSKIAQFVSEKLAKGEAAKLVFICTHNSRRSHFGQVSAAIAAEYYGFKNVESYSGGTEATAFHPNAIQALRMLGFEISDDAATSNPRYTLDFGGEKTIQCFSKRYNDAANPKEGFAAIMTCSDAEQNCPFIPGVSLRVGTTYLDPKASDGLPEQEATYSARFRQIATEMLYAFSLVKNTP